MSIMALLRKMLTVDLPSVKAQGPEYNVKEKRTYGKQLRFARLQLKTRRPTVYVLGVLACSSLAVDTLCSQNREEKSDAKL